MLSEQEAFKLGVLAEFADKGLSVDQMRERVKCASDALDAVAAIPDEETSDDESSPMDKAAWDQLLKMIGSGSKTALIGAALAPPAIGAAAGVAHSKLTDVDEDDVDTVKRKELIDEYRRQAARLRQTKELQTLTARKPSGGLYL
jgi:hypothetical protein